MKRKYEELNEKFSDIDTEALRKEALKKTQQYQEKIKLGEELYKKIGEVKTLAREINQLY